MVPLGGASLSAEVEEGRTEGEGALRDDQNTDEEDGDGNGKGSMGLSKLLGRNNSAAAKGESENEEPVEEERSSG
jgi:hypothetical protein